MTSTNLTEAIARALYRMNGHANDPAFEQEPMWRRYVARSREVMADVRDSAPEDADPVLWRLFCDVAAVWDGTEGGEDGRSPKGIPAAAWRVVLNALPELLEAEAKREAGTCAQPRDRANDD